MTIDKLIEVLKQRNWLFEIQIPGKSAFGKNKIESIEGLHGSLTEYLHKIAKNNNVEQLAIQLYAPNGSSFIRKDFFLLDIKPVVESTKSVDTSTNIVEPSTKTVEPSTKSVEPTIPNKMDVSTQIENAELKAELRYIKQRNEELEKRAKDAEHKCDNYYTENLQLSRDAATQKDKLDLEYQGKVLNLEKDKKSGLSGIMDEVKNLPPEAWQLFGNIIGKPITVAGSNPSPELNGANTVKHENADAQAGIDIMVGILTTLPAESVAMLVMIVEALSKNDQHLKNAFHVIVEKAGKKQEKKDVGNTKNDDEDLDD
jgi:hypothetical protein